MIPDATLREILRLAEAATPGPWEHGSAQSGSVTVRMPRGRSAQFWNNGPIVGVYGADGIASDVGGAVAGVDGPTLDGLTEDEYDRQRQRDAAYIAALGTHGRAMAEELLRARKLLRSAELGMSSASETDEGWRSAAYPLIDAIHAFLEARK